MASDVPYSPQKAWFEARKAVRAAELIIDAEVVEAPVRKDNGAYQPARLRAVRVLKGPAQDSYLLDVQSHCDALAWVKAGERYRLFLVRHGDLWRESGGAAPAMVDPMLKSNRYKPWPDGKPGQRKDD